MAFKTDSCQHTQKQLKAKLNKNLETKEVTAKNVAFYLFLGQQSFWSWNYCFLVVKWLTWNTVTSAQKRSSKFARAALFSPSSSGNMYLPPKRFIPSILAVKMKRINRARKVITLSIVWIITSNWRLRAGKKRTSLNMRSSRKDRRTDILLLPSPNSSTMLKKGTNG